MKKLYPVFLALALCLALLTLSPALAESAFVLPEGLLEIQEEAFLNVPISEIAVPDGCAAIGPRAFSNTGLTRAILPSSVQTIANDAFEGCPDLICRVESGSDALSWCVRNDVAYELLVSSIVLDAETLLLEPGGSAALTATVLPEDAAIIDLSWISSDPAVASVDETGRVTAVSVGEATITANATDGSGVSATCAVSVKVLITSIALDAETLELERGSSAALTATVLPEDATISEPSWTSSDPDVATVDETGRVTAVSAGEATITAEAADGSGVSATCAVTVSDNTLYRALLIGESEFYNSSGGISSRAARNAGDVTLMRDMLVSVQGPTGRSYVGNITSLLNISVEGTQAAIQEALGGADDNDVSLFFIATHGDYTSSGEAAGALQMSSGGFLRLNRLAEWLSAVPGKVIVIVESCGSGAAIYVEEDPQDAELSAEAAMNALAAFDRAVIRAFSSMNAQVIVAPPDDELLAGDFLVENKFYVLTASAYQEQSWGLADYNMFTRWLTNGIGTEGPMPADSGDANRQYDGDGNGVTTLYELYRYISIVGDKKKFRPAGSEVTYSQHVQAYPSIRNGSLELFTREGAAQAE